jgi:hypothetical protein
MREAGSLRVVWASDVIGDVDSDDGEIDDEIWGRCYDYNFERFVSIFGERKLAFFLKTSVMIIFA